MKTLFKIKAYYGHKGQSYESYYVIAENSTDAERKVMNYHRKMDYLDVDFCNSETIAQANEYGKPSILLT